MSTSGNTAGLAPGVASSAALNSEVTRATTAEATKEPISSLEGDVSGKIGTGGPLDTALNGAFAPHEKVIYAVRYGVKADGVTDDTTALQNAVNAASGNLLVLPAGTMLVSSQINLNGVGGSTPANNQWSGPVGIFGQGSWATKIKATGIWTAGTFVVKLNNVAAGTYGGFMVDGNGHADSGADLSWIGGSQGNPALAPSTMNTWRDIFVQGCSAYGVKLDNQNDAKISRIITRGAASTGTGLSVNASGGMVTLDDCHVASGPVVIAAQNGSIRGLNAFDGLVLTGASYNQLDFAGGQIYPNGSTGVVIDSSGAIGNATRGVNFGGVQFNGAPPTGFILRGRLWQGVRFEACQFQGWTNFFGTISPAAGTGELPIVFFDGCSFESATPASVSNQVIVKIRACRGSTGARVDGSIDGTDLVANFNASAGTFTVSGGYLYEQANVSGTYPSTSGNGHALGWNFSGGAGEADFFNTYTAGQGFRFYQMTGAGAGTQVASIDQNGGINAAGALSGNGLILTPRAAASTVANELFVDSADHLLKFRDNSNTVRTVNVT